MARVSVLGVGCPSGLQATVNGHTPAFGEPATFCALPFRSHCSVKVGGVKPLAAWKSCTKKEPESLNEMIKRNREEERDCDVLVTFSSLSLSRSHICPDMFSLLPSCRLSSSHLPLSLSLSSPWTAVAAACRSPLRHLCTEGTSWPAPVCRSESWCRPSSWCSSCSVFY